MSKRKLTADEAIADILRFVHGDREDDEEHDSGDIGTGVKQPGTCSLLLLLL